MKIVYISLFAAVFFACGTKTDKIMKTETTQASSEFVPQWAKEVVWYQIFPERFYDGDPSNNPRVEDLAGADPQEPIKHWNIHQWTSDWYKLQDYEKKNGDKEWWKHALRRRYGGDLQGIILKLDYLKELGITAIYLNPVFDSPSLHKYDGASYHHIDPNFGPDPSGDRALMATENPLDPKTWVWTKADELALKLIDEAHKRGMRIIFDGVFNHKGINSFAFKDVVKNQEKSAYKDWFIIKSWDDKDKSTTFDYEGWFGVKSLPELREDENGIVSGPREYIFASTERWMNPKGKGTQYGIDGWRLDVAFCVSHTFWKAWRKHVRDIKPEAYMTAEIIDAPEKVEPYLQGDEFDGEMNYNFAFTCSEFFFNPKEAKITATQFDEKLKFMRELYPAGVPYVVQNLFGSHDANRIGSHIVNRGIGDFRDWGKYYGTSQVGNNPKYLVRKPNADEIQLQKLFIVMQMTYVGAPMIYYGDEVGMWGANDPDCRKPMVWQEFSYEPETYNPDGTTRTPDAVAVNTDLLNFYKQMISIRNTYKSLRLGIFRTLLADNAKDVFAFEREFEGEKIIVVINNSESEQTINLKLDKNLKFKNLIDNSDFVSNKSGLILKIDGKWAAVLLVSES